MANPSKIPGDLIIDGNITANNLINPVYALNKNFTTGTITGTSEADMHTYTFAAGEFAADGDTAWWDGDVITTGTAVSATNTFRIYVDGSVIQTISFTNQGSATSGSGVWRLKLMRKDATTLSVSSFFLGQRAAGTNFQWGKSETQTVTLSNSFIIKVTGQCGQAGGTMSALSSIITRA